MKYISVLGSSGSIGTQTLKVIKEHPKEFKIVALCTHSNIELLKKQIREFKPQIAAVFDENKAKELAKQVSIQILSGLNGIKKIAAYEKADTVVNALVGSIGIEPTMEAIKAKKNIALANKETLVAAGSIVMREAKKNNVSIMPIDSEHSALFQCLVGEDRKNIKKMILTASGGPFRNYSKKELEKVTLQKALSHPTWKMGSKITIDSATLMNKGFEVIEAHWLYDIAYEKIDVVIHPQSIIHSMVEFVDGSIKAQLSLPNMKMPIQYALSYPNRLALSVESLDLAKIRQLTFEKQNNGLFPCLGYAYEAGKKEGTMGAVLNAANEVAVQAFLDKKIPFTSIPIIIKKAMDDHTVIKNPTLSQVVSIDKKTKEEAKKSIETKRRS